MPHDIHKKLKFMLSIEIDHIISDFFYIVGTELLSLIFGVN